MVKSMSKNLPPTHKTKNAAIALTLLLIITGATFLTAANYASAHTPAWNIQPYVYVYATPNPAEVGSAVRLFYWVSVTPATGAANSIGYAWQNITIEVTKPDHTTQTLGPVTADYSSGGSLYFTPDQLGTYNATIHFPTQVLLKGTNPSSTSVYVNDTYLEAYSSITFTVQDSVPDTSFADAPLPVSYWERPIDTNNLNWATIASNWLGQNLAGATYLKYQPYGWAPNTAHTLLKIPLSAGGIVGGGASPNNPEVTYYQGEASGKVKFNNPIILNGVLYYPLPLANAATGGGVTAVDLRTGKTLWTNTDLTSISFAQLYDYESTNEHGVETGYLWATGTATGTGITNPGDAAVNATRYTYAPGTINLGQVPTVTNSAAKVSAANSWLAIDPQTGRVLFNETDVPTTGVQVYGPNGEWLKIGIGSASATSPYTYLWEWNNTKLPGNDRLGAFPVWSPGTTNWNLSTAYDWNVTLSEPLRRTSNQFGDYAPSIIRVLPGDVVYGQSSGLGQTSSLGGTPSTYTLWAININASRGAIGQVLWQKDYTAPEGNLTVVIGPTDAENDIFTLYSKETLQWSGYNILTGDKIWGPTASESSLDFHGGTSTHLFPYSVGYGTLYSTGYSGIVYAYDTKTGNLLFTYGNDPTNPKNSTASSDAPYGHYGLAVAAVANNKVYLVSADYNPSSPSYQGASTIAIDAFTGKELWKVYGTSQWEQQAVADGYYVWLNLNSQLIYVTGPGPSATTVSAPDSGVTSGSSVEIKGTVTDQSPALKGTAAISDQDQGAWTNYAVEHVTAQPTVTGVPVQITIKAQDGTTVQTATVTSDSSGTYHYAWTPAQAGEYSVIANFAGTQSYGPSSATTALVVNAAQATPAPVQQADNTPYFLAIIGLAVAIAVVLLALTVLTLKRKVHP